MKIENTPCYILHRRDYRETSLLLEIFSEDYGRTSLVAKGAKRNKKQQGINYSIFQKYMMSWISKSELGTLTKTEVDDVMSDLEPDNTLVGFYMNEIILRLLHKHEPHPELFKSYDYTINQLSKNSCVQTVLRYFEKKLMQSLGYGLIFDQDIITGEPIVAEENYFYKVDQGPSFKTKDSGDGVTVTGKTLIELDNETLSDDKNKNEAKILLRTLLNHLLGGKPLASRQLYKSYIKNKPSN